MHLLRLKGPRIHAPPPPTTRLTIKSEVPSFFSHSPLPQDLAPRRAPICNFSSSFFFYLILHFKYNGQPCFLRLSILDHYDWLLTMENEGTFLTLLLFWHLSLSLSLVSHTHTEPFHHPHQRGQPSWLRPNLQLKAAQGMHTFHFFPAPNPGETHILAGWMEKLGQPACSGGKQETQPRCLPLLGLSWGRGGRKYRHYTGWPQRRSRKRQGDPFSLHKQQGLVSQMSSPL